MSLSFEHGKDEENKMSKVRTINVAELAKQAGFSVNEGYSEIWAGEEHHSVDVSAELKKLVQLVLMEAAVIAHEKGKATTDREDVFRGQHKAAGCYSAEAAIMRVANHMK
jgi:hypothetical protein